MTIVCTGSIAYDYLMSFPGNFRDHILPDKLDCISLSFLVDTLIRQRGGTAPNIACTLALLGEKPIVVGTVGDDFEDYRKFLENIGVDTTYVKVIPGKYTASFFANTDLSNNQIASFYAGAMANASEISLKNILKIMDLVVISPNDPKAMDQYAEECQQIGVPYIYDPGQQVVRSKPDEIRRGILNAHSLFLNDYEFMLVQKHTGLKKNDILKKVKFMVITRGEKGAEIFAGDEKFSIPVVPPTSIQDPTGVGDAFRGGFLRGYHLNYDWRTCGQLGALAATYCLEQSGPQNHSYTIQEFKARYRVHFDDQGILESL